MQLARAFEDLSFFVLSHLAYLLIDQFFAWVPLFFQVLVMLRS